MQLDNNNYSPHPLSLESLGLLDENRKLFKFNDDIDVKIANDVTLVITSRESSEYFFSSMKNIATYVPVATKIIVVAQGDYNTRSRQKRFTGSLSLNNAVFLDPGTEFASIKSLRGLAFDQVTTKYVYYMNYDAFPWVLNDEDPLGCIRMLYYVAQAAGPQYVALVPQLVQQTYPHQSQDKWPGHGPPDAGNQEAFIPLIVDKENNIRRNYSAIRDLQARVISIMEDHIVLFRTDSSEHFYTKNVTSVCSAFELRVVDDSVFPKGKFMLHVPWAFAVFKFPQVYISHVSLPYYSYIRGETCAAQENLARLRNIRIYSMEFTDLFFMGGCKWSADSTVIANFSLAMPCGGLMPPDRLTQIGLFVSALGMFMFNEFSIASPYNFMGIAEVHNLLRINSSANIFADFKLMATRTYAYPACLYDKQMRCFPMHSPVATVRVSITTNVPYSKLGYCMDQFLAQNSFIVTENSRNNITELIFFQVTTPDVMREDNGTSIFNEFIHNAQAINNDIMNNAYPDVKALLGGHGGVFSDRSCCSVDSQKQIPHAHNICNAPIQVSMVLCAAGLTKSSTTKCHLDIDFGPNWRLKQLKHVNIESSRRMLNQVYQIDTGSDVSFFDLMHRYKI